MRGALLGEPAVEALSVLEERQGELRPVRIPPTGSRGEIRFLVENGIVTLSGEVPGLGLKRLAGVLAWWVPSSRDVVKGIAVVPLEEDADDEMTDAVRIALEKDPYMEAAQVRVGTHDRVVTLTGLVRSESERHMAEFDAWCVDRVVNEIEALP